VSVESLRASKGRGDKPRKRDGDGLTVQGYARFPVGDGCVMSFDRVGVQGVCMGPSRACVSGEA
jgi:hypothetical protein